MRRLENSYRRSSMKTSLIMNQKNTDYEKLIYILFIFYSISCLFSHNHNINSDGHWLVGRISTRSTKKQINKSQLNLSDWAQNSQG